MEEGIKQQRGQNIAGYPQYQIPLYQKYPASYGGCFYIFFGKEGMKDYRWRVTTKEALICHPELVSGSYQTLLTARTKEMPKQVRHDS